MSGADIPGLSELDDRENELKKKQRIKGNNPENLETTSISQEVEPSTSKLVIKSQSNPSKDSYLM